MLEAFAIITLIIAAIAGALRVNLVDKSDLLVPYSHGLAWQNRLLEKQLETRETVSLDRSAATAGTLLMLQHRSVYTLGTGTEGNSGPFSRVSPDGRELQYEIFPTERAGQATYHGPGQIVLYPIVDLVGVTLRVASLLDRSSLTLL